MGLIPSILISIFGSLFILGWLFALAERSEEGEMGIIGAVMKLATIFLAIAGGIFLLIQVLS